MLLFMQYPRTLAVAASRQRVRSLVDVINVLLVCINLAQKLLKLPLQNLSPKS